MELEGRKKCTKCDNLEKKDKLNWSLPSRQNLNF